MNDNKWIFWSLGAVLAVVVIIVVLGTSCLVFGVLSEMKYDVENTTGTTGIASGEVASESETEEAPIATQGSTSAPTVPAEEEIPNTTAETTGNNGGGSNGSNGNNVGNDDDGREIDFDDLLGWN